MGALDIKANESSLKRSNFVVLDFPKLERINDRMILTGPLDRFTARFGKALGTFNAYIHNTHITNVTLDTQPISWITIFDNTPIPTYQEDATLRSLEVKATRVDGRLNVAGNVYYTAVSMPNMEYASHLRIYNNTDFETITSSASEIQSVNVSHNGRRTGLSFPQLKLIGYEPTEGWYGLCKASNTCFGSFQGLFAINLPALAKLVSEHEGLHFINNSISSLQLPSLSHVNGSFQVEDNELLRDVVFPRFESIASSLIVRNNTQLLNFTANVLKKVGDVEMSGAFTNVEFFSLREAASFDLRSTDPSMDCSWLDSNFQGKVVKGAYNCVGNHTAPLTPRRPSTPTDLPGAVDPDLNQDQDVPVSLGGSDGLSTGAKAGIGIGASVGGLALIGFGVWVLLRRRKGVEAQAQAPSREEIGKPELDGKEKPGVEKNSELVEADGGGERVTRELPTSRLGDLTGRAELGVTGRREGEVVELP